MAGKRKNEQQQGGGGVKQTQGGGMDEKRGAGQEPLGSGRQNENLGDRESLEDENEEAGAGRSAGGSEKNANQDQNIGFGQRSEEIVRRETPGSNER